MLSYFFHSKIFHRYNTWKYPYLIWIIFKYLFLYFFSLSLPPKEKLSPDFASSMWTLQSPTYQSLRSWWRAEAPWWWRPRTPCWVHSRQTCSQPWCGTCARCAHPSTTRCRRGGELTERTARCLSMGPVARPRSQWSVSHHRTRAVPKWGWWRACRCRWWWRRLVDPGVLQSRETRLSHKSKQTLCNN